jgi:hypothetical protein
MSWRDQFKSKKVKKLDPGEFYEMTTSMPSSYTPSVEGASPGGGWYKSEQAIQNMTTQEYVEYRKSIIPSYDNRVRVEDAEEYIRVQQLEEQVEALFQELAELHERLDEAGID